MWVRWSSCLARVSKRSACFFFFFFLIPLFNKGATFFWIAQRSNSKLLSVKEMLRSWTTTSATHTQQRGDSKQRWRGRGEALRIDYRIGCEEEESRAAKSLGFYTILGGGPLFVHPTPHVKTAHPCLNADVPSLKQSPHVTGLQISQREYPLLVLSFSGCARTQKANLVIDFNQPWIFIAHSSKHCNIFVMNMAKTLPPGYRLIYYPPFFSQRVMRVERGEWIMWQ